MILQTFVNETRLPEQIYVTLKSGDTLKFGEEEENIFSLNKVYAV